MDDLEDVDSESIQKKYHEFATILRQHNVGSRENAFDKLVNLFLAKIVDESVNNNELQFYWKGAAHDDYFSLQDRLQKLYKEGMEKFLGEQVTYIDQKEISDAFHLFKNDPDATKRKVLDYFRQLKFYTNNDFAFLDVHNETLFYQNAVILKKIVQMLEDIRLKTENQNQFLGDLFEGFLDQGVKQSEGQYFTPMPIVKFLVSSLPLEKIIKNSAEIPKAIDYACGAGHFLTEYAACVKNAVEKHKNISVTEYYKEIYGIEKEYRLSKVAKVSAFMYGQDEIKIIYGDALAQNKEIENGKFSVLIANPPYSVKGFLETLTEAERNNYEVTNQVSDMSRNNSIEVFFVERAKQLLKSGGVAAIVLPSSILSNGNIYTSCREIILKYFDIIAIVEFGSSTFGKTGTNTITIFLRRKGSNPDLAEHYRNRVDSWFEADNTKDVVFMDTSFIDRYCSYCGIDAVKYKEWLCGGKIPTAAIFADYKKNAQNSVVYKHIQKKKITKRYTCADKERQLRECMEGIIKSVEKEKLYYFMLAASNSSSVVVVKSPTDKKQMKLFLGYEWSGTKGSEGIKYIGARAVDEEDMIGKNKGINRIVTPLFDPCNYDAKGKINTMIRQNFDGDDILIPDSLKEYVSVYPLVSMLDFSRADFDKAIKISGIRKKTIFKYPVRALESLMVEVAGNKTKISRQEIREAGLYPVVTQERDSLITGYSDSKAPVTDHPLIVFGDHSCTFKYIDFDFVRGADGTQLIKVDESVILTKYLYYFLDQAEIENREKYERHLKYLRRMEIPCPPLELQRRIIEECEDVDAKYCQALAENERLKREMEGMISGVSGENKKLRDVCAKINPSKSAIRTVPSDMVVSFVEMTSVSNEGYIETMVDRPLGELRKGSYTYFAENDVIVAKITPCMENGKCALATGLTNQIGMGSSEFHVFRANCALILPAYLFYALNREVIRQAAAKQMTGASGHRRVPILFYEDLWIAVPSLPEQRRIISEMKKREEQIVGNNVIMSKCAGRKKEIIERALI